jgi:hypothetical protein
LSARFTRVVRLFLSCCFGGDADLTDLAAGVPGVVGEMAIFHERFAEPVADCLSEKSGEGAISTDRLRRLI